MNSSSANMTNPSHPRSRNYSLLQALAKRGLLAKMAGLERGRVELQDRQDAFGFGNVSPDFPEVVKIRVNDMDFYPDIAFGGAVGAGESYMLGLWDCNNLVELMRIMIVNPQVLDSINGGMSMLRKPLHKMFHLFHRNSVRGSRRNIQAHYDLGNDFFSQFLDDTLMYSSAVFERDDADLKAASIAKLDLICRKLELAPSDHILEIGTGWGGFAIHAALHYGCRVTTTTISQAQYELASQRVAEAGLEDQVTLLTEDFRSLRGQFDKLVSIEMIEAVGEQNIGRFFEVCNRCLKPGGKMLLQAITIRDQLFDRYRKSVDFIQRFIFPGGFLPSLKLLSEQLGKRSDFRILHLEDIGLHYAETLKCWRKNFHVNQKAIQSQGHSRDFIRLWDFYFCYCAAGFLQASTGAMQMLLVKDRDRIV
jgi:cyclopropane-fatty-acyl-phospholipid synthase